MGDFDLFMDRKGLSLETKKLYNIYLGKLDLLMKETGQDMSQTILDAFLDVYPNVVSRAFLKNYLEFRNITDLKIQKKTGRKQQKEVEVMSEEDMNKMKDYLYRKDMRWGLLFELTAKCALRRQEALNIKAGDISTETIDGNLVMFILIKKAKGNKERKVFVPSDTAITLVKFIAMNNLRVDDWLFRSFVHPEKHIDKTVWNRQFTIASLVATHKRYHPHQLRHYRSLEWFDKGVDIVRIQQRLGHSGISTTRLYINPDKRKELERWSKEE